MKYIIFSFAFLVLASRALATPIWTSCGTSADPIQVSHVILTPSTPVVGQPVQIKVQGTLDHTVSSGKSTLIVKRGFIPLYTHNEPFGSLAAGPFEQMITLNTPESVPSGTYTSSLVFYDQNNVQLTCVDIDMTY